MYHRLVITIHIVPKHHLSGNVTRYDEMYLTLADFITERLYIKGEESMIQSHVIDENIIICYPIIKLDRKKVLHEFRAIVACVILPLWISNYIRLIG